MDNNEILKKFFDNRPELRETIENLDKMDKTAKKLVEAANELYWAQKELAEVGAKAEADIVKNLFDELKALRENLQSKYPECNFSTLFETLHNARRQ